MRKEQQSQIVCQRCGRKLKDTKWTAVGYGRRCYKKFLKEEWERNQMTIFDFIEDTERVKEIEANSNGRNREEIPY